MSLKRLGRRGSAKWQQRGPPPGGVPSVGGVAPTGGSDEGEELRLSEEEGAPSAPLKAEQRKAGGTDREHLKKQLEWLQQQLALGPLQLEEAELPPSNPSLLLPPAVLLQGFPRLNFQPLGTPLEGPSGAPPPLPLKTFSALHRSCAAAKAAECRRGALRAAVGPPRDVLSGHLQRALESQQRAKEARNQQAAREAAAEAAAAAARAAAAAAAAEAVPSEHLNTHHNQQQQQHQQHQQHQQQQDANGRYASFHNEGSSAAASFPLRPTDSFPNGGGREALQGPWGGPPGDWGPQRQQGGAQAGPLPYSSAPSGRQLEGHHSSWTPEYTSNSNSSSSSSSSRYHVAAGDYDAWAGPVVLSTVQHADWEGKSFPWDAEVQRKSVINAVLCARDVFVMMPTGGGKSLCFQLPAVVSRGVTAVFMPLLSLMQDQMEQLQALGVACRAFTSNQTWEEQRQVYEDLRDEDSGIHLVFLTPEKLSGSKALRSALHELNRQGRLSRFAIDEAHCVSQWGNDFRPDYCQLRRLREEFPNVPIVALTATATVAVLHDVQRQLGMREPVVFQRSFDRPNLRYEVLPKQRLRAVQQVVDIIMQNFRGLCGIVYCLSQRDCERVAEGLEDAGIAAAFYHAKLDADKREHVQRCWMQNQFKVIVATLAFGMGVNKKDVRFESGRAGRDGEEARCILLYDYHDKQRQTFLMQSGSEGRGRGVREQQGQQNAANLLVMLQYCEELFECRRVFILRHFGEDFRGRCDTECDNCKRRRTLKPHVVPCGKLASEVVSLVRALRSKAPSFPLTLASLRDALLGRKVKGSKYQQLMQAYSQFGCLQRARWTQTATARLLHFLVIHEVLWERCVASSNQQGSFTTYIELGRKAETAESSVQSLVMEESPTGATKRSAKAGPPAQQGEEASSFPTKLQEAPAKRARIVSSGHGTATSCSNAEPVAGAGNTTAAAARGGRNARDLDGGGGGRGPLLPPLAAALRRRLLSKREELATTANLRTTKSIATNAAIEAVVQRLPATVAQLQALPFKELQGGKKGEKYGQVFVTEVRAFLSENHLTHLLQDTARPPPLAALPAAEDADDEEFISIGGEAENPQNFHSPAGKPEITGGPPKLNSLQPWVSQSIYFKPPAAMQQPQAAAGNIKTVNATMESSERTSFRSLQQEQPTQWEQKAGGGLQPQHTAGNQAAYAAPDLWDPEDLDCLDYL
ncbi:hypothetical protein Efla_007351 [Eimeria flavescens]